MCFTAELVHLRASPEAPASTVCRWKAHKLVSVLRRVPPRWNVAGKPGVRLEPELRNSGKRISPHSHSRRASLVRLRLIGAASPPPPPNSVITLSSESPGILAEVEECAAPRLGRRAIVYISERLVCFPLYFSPGLRTLELLKQGGV